MRRQWLLVLALASSGASAQSVYKCVASNGVASFQSEPCSDPAQVRKVWDATPPHLSNAEQWQIHNARKKAASDAAYLRRLAHGNGTGSGSTMAGIGNDRCGAAKRDRDRFYANNPRRRSKDMERWNKYVYDACK